MINFNQIVNYFTSKNVLWKYSKAGDALLFAVKLPMSERDITFRICLFRNGVNLETYFLGQRKLSRRLLEYINEKNNQYNFKTVLDNEGYLVVRLSIPILDGVEIFDAKFFLFEARILAGVIEEMETEVLIAGYDDDEDVENDEEDEEEYDEQMESLYSYLLDEEGMEGSLDVEYYSNGTMIQVKGAEGAYSIFDDYDLQIIHIYDDMDKYQLVFNKLAKVKISATSLNPWLHKWNKELEDSHIVLDVTKDYYLKLSAYGLNFHGSNSAHLINKEARHILDLYNNVLKKELKNLR